MKVSPITGAPIIATVRCGACLDERRRNPGVLGYVVSGERGRGWESGVDRNRFGKLASGAARHTARRSGESVWLGHDDVWEPPETVFAWCRNHGGGRVATGELLRARGSVTLYLSASG